ncbi:MAG TPA: hypothetical protein VGS23_04235 [Thermoplasmata archaeon]|nr:hypothetical protein [Thermoplasmata archaeon]
MSAALQVLSDRAWGYDAAPPAIQDRSGWVCSRCRSDAPHNEVLRISFCRVHGLTAELVPIGGFLAYRRVGMDQPTAIVPVARS